MYLHVGSNKNIRTNSIIGIFDMDNITVSAITRKYLNTKQKDGCVFSVSDGEIPKSFILFNNGEKRMICFSPLSVSALKGRLEENSL